MSKGGYRGLKSFLAGDQVTSLDDYVVPDANEQLPSLLKVTIHNAEDLYQPTIASMIKFNPYIACYLTPDKQNKLKTHPKVFATTSPTFGTTLSFAYAGQPLLVVQAWDSDILRHEFIGETPVDLLSIINTYSRRWTGPLTVWGFKGTVPHGKVWVTIEFEGGTEYNSRRPAGRRSANEMFRDDGRSPLRLPNIKKVAKSMTTCC